MNFTLNVFLPDLYYIELGLNKIIINKLVNIKVFIISKLLKIIF